jgi:peptidoglycan/xylan/chitin deacetylase (PgdA/CDA1 family)
MKTAHVLPAILFASTVVAAAQAPERPPQFVAMAFDNCTELERWQELTDFVAEMNKDGDRVHFTFFVSGSNFIADGSRNVYEGPGQRRGASRINFGGSAEEVRKRVGYVSRLAKEGHEVASHAVGHFDGRAWSAAEWAKEFRSFHDVLDKVAHNNGLDAETRFPFPATQVTGFRAPYLANSPGLYAVLKENGYRYDASGDSAADAWPEKIGGVWRFNLARLRLHKMGKSALSMDYNFFVAHSRAVDDPQRYALYRDQVLQTYLAYFRTNYSGNRAPLHIGHHFADYQGGAYKHALMAFARQVCGTPEVRCVTYSRLADFMDGLRPETLAAYRNGDFPRAGAPGVTVSELSYE